LFQDPYSEEKVEVDNGGKLISPSSTEPVLIMLSVDEIKVTIINSDEIMLLIEEGRQYWI